MRFQLFALLLISQVTLAQPYKLSGTIRDSLSGDSLPFANVLIQNGEFQKGVHTDFNGLFNMDSLNPGAYSLQVQYVGFHSKKLSLSLSADSNLLINLKADNSLIADPPIIDFKTGFMLISDSLGNTYCVDATKNKVDSLGRKHGPWVNYFLDYSETNSVYKIGQKMAEGNYYRGHKDGPWHYYDPLNQVWKTEYYKRGKLLKTEYYGDQTAGAPLD